MSRLTTNIGLSVWDVGTDSFNHVQLAANWDLIDSYLATFDATSKMPTGFRTVSTVPVGGTAGRFAMLTAQDGGFAPYTLLKYDGTSWKPVGYEILSAVPTSGNFGGRIVVLSSANSGFNAWDVIRYNGSSWSLLGGMASVNTGAGALNILGLQTTGDVYISSGSRGLVLVDRTTGTKYRLYIDNAGILIEAVT